MGGFIGKFVAVIGLLALFIFGYNAMEAGAPERDAAYQQGYDSAQQNIRNTYEYGERETGISNQNDHPGFASDDGYDDGGADDWGSDS